MSKKDVKYANIVSDRAILIADVISEQIDTLHETIARLQKRDKMSETAHDVIAEHLYILEQDVNLLNYELTKSI